MAAASDGLRELGHTGMRITPVGLGTWAIGGGGWEFGWGAQDDAASIATIRRAVELGVNWIDTAPAYGTGHAEEVVGRALKGVTPRPFVFTKVSLLWDRARRIVHSLKRDSVRKEVEESLRRLGVSALDLCQVHWPDPPDEIEEGWRALAELKEEGKIRHIGVSNFSVEQMRRVQRVTRVETLQPPYSIVAPEVEYTVLPYAAREGIGVLAYSPMACGLLSGTMTRERVARLAPDDWRRTGKEFREPRLGRNLALAKLLGDIGRPHSRSAGDVAIAWTLRNPAVTAAIVGARSPKQVEGWVGARSFRLSDTDLRAISEFVRSHP